jgi:hypothetical protein
MYLHVAKVASVVWSVSFVYHCFIQPSEACKMLMCFRESKHLPLVEFRYGTTVLLPINIDCNILLSTGNVTALIKYVLLSYIRFRTHFQ